MIGWSMGGRVHWNLMNDTLHVNHNIFKDEVVTFCVCIFQLDRVWVLADLLIQLGEERYTYDPQIMV